MADIQDVERELLKLQKDLQSLERDLGRNQDDISKLWSTASELSLKAERQAGRIKSLDQSVNQQINSVVQSVNHQINSLVQSVNQLKQSFDDKFAVAERRNTILWSFVVTLIIGGLLGVGAHMRVVGAVEADLKSLIKEVETLKAEQKKLLPPAVKSS